MGMDKAAALVEGEPMISRVAAALVGAGLDVLVAGPARPEFDLPTVPDAPGHGPVAGLVGAMDAYPLSSMFVVAVDQPRIRPETAAALTAINGDVVAPLWRNVPQVTCAMYRPAVASVARDVLRSERASLRAIVDRTEAVLVPEASWRSWGEDGRSWRSIDTPDDLAAENLD